MASKTKPTVTTAAIRKHGVRGVMQDMEAALIGHSYDWRLASNEECSKLTEAYVTALRELTAKYLADCRNAVSY